MGSLPIRLLRRVALAAAASVACAGPEGDGAHTRRLEDLLSPAEIAAGMTGYGAEDTAYIHGGAPRADTAARLARVALWRVEGHMTDSLTKRLLCAALIMGVADSTFHLLASQVFSAMDDSIAVEEVAMDWSLRWPNYRRAAPLKRVVVVVAPRDSPGAPSHVSDLGCAATLRALRS